MCYAFKQLSPLPRDSNFSVQTFVKREQPDSHLEFVVDKIASSRWIYGCSLHKS